MNISRKFYFYNEVSLMFNSFFLCVYLQNIWTTWFELRLNHGSIDVLWTTKSNICVRLDTDTISLQYINCTYIYGITAVFHKSCQYLYGIITINRNSIYPNIRIVRVPYLFPRIWGGSRQTEYFIIHYNIIIT